MENEVVLSNQELSEVPAELVTTHGATLVSLDLTENRLVSSAHLDQFPQMHTLILDKNELSVLPSNFPVLPSVTTLWINHNAFADLPELLNQIDACFPNIEYLSMMKNNCCPDMYFGDEVSLIEAYRRYRYFVIYRLKKLQFLDASPVDYEERETADRVGAQMAPRRPNMASTEAVARTAGTTTTTTSNHTPAASKEPQTAAYLAKNKPKYDGSNSEGNRFIMNSDL